MQTMMNKALLLFSFLVLVGCSASKPLHQSDHYYNYIQPSFAEYIQATHQWLKANRSFLSDEHRKEIEMNMPFEHIPEKADKAILLIHGLGDSPYSFVDIASSLEQRNFHVQVLLLPGHGSNPEHMHLAQYQDWQDIVNHYADLLKQKYDHVWLGGFSTGANLVSTYTLNNQNIDGLLLFSPGFHSLTPVLEKFIPVASIFWDSMFEEKEDNFAKYNSMPLHGMNQYAKSAAVFRDEISDTSINIPTLMVLSEADSIINTDKIQSLFSTQFTHQNSKLIWYGSNEKIQISEKVSIFSMDRGDLRISTASHMSPLFSPTNPYYGKEGEKIICDNSLNEEHIAYCNQGNEVWFSAWGHTDDNKVHARLTWNPYFDQLEDEIINITDSTGY